MRNFVQAEITKVKEEPSDGIEPSNNAKDDINDKLMLDEDKEVGAVSLKVFKSFIKYYGGLCYIIFLCLVVASWVESTSRLKSSGCLTGVMT